MIKNRNRIATLLLVVACLSLTGCADAVGDGMELLKEEKYTEATAEFEKAIEKEKDLGEAYRGLGLSYWEQEAYEEAAEAFENALNNGAEKTATIYNLLGICKMKTGAMKKAAFYFETGLTKEDAGDELRQEMAFNEIAAYEAAGNYVEARHKLRSYVEAYPEDEEAAKELEFLETQVKEQE